MAGSRFFYRSYNDAKKATIRLNIRNFKDYQLRHKVDSNLPSNPALYYKEQGWNGWPEFLDPHPSYAVASKLVQKAGVQSISDFRRRREEEFFEIPENPDHYYRDSGWTDWKKFLGREIYQSYEKAKIAATELGVQTASEYFKKFRSDPRLPSNPNLSYKDKGWVDWFHFLGKSKHRFYEYAECAEVVQKMGLKKYQEYKEIYKRYPRLPSNPEITYRNKGWVSWNAFLGKPVEKFYENYENARNAVWALEIITQTQYRKDYKKDIRLPSNPNIAYKNKGWVDWHDYLGNEAFVAYATYEEARTAVQKLGIPSVTEYRKRYLDDDHLHSHPNICYRNKGWEGWKKFLGTETKFLSFEKAQELIRAKGIRTSVEYIKRYRDYESLPSNPQQYYKDSGWLGWKNFLRTEKG